MRRKLAIRQAVGTVLALFALFFVLGQCRCALFQDPATQAEAAYLGEQLACVDKSKTLDGSHECRRKVREKWGIAETSTKVKP